MTFSSPPISTGSPGIHARYLVALSFCSLLTYVCCTVYFRNYLYADGSAYFYSMLANDGFQLWPVGRATSQFFMQVFAVLGIRAGISDVAVLGGLFGFGTTFWTALFYTLTVIMLLRRGRYEYVGIVVLWTGLSLVLTGFFVQIESVIATSLFSYCLFGILLSSDPNTKSSPNRLALWMASALTIGMNEYYLIWGCLLLVLIVWKIIRREICPSLYWKSLSVVFVVSVTAACLGIQAKDSSDVVRSIHDWPRQIGLMAVIGLMVLLILLSGDYRSLRGRGVTLASWMLSHQRALSRLRNSLQLLIGIAFLAGICFHSARIAQSSFENRFWNLEMSVVLSMIVVFLEYSHTRLLPISNVAGLLCGGMILFFALSSHGYGKYLKGVTEFCGRSSGFVSVEDSRINESGFCWGWPVPMESVCAQMINGSREIRCIIVEEHAANGWRPFDTTNIDAYAPFDEYGVKYVGFAEERQSPDW